MGEGLPFLPKGCGGTLAMVGDVGADSSGDDEFGESGDTGSKGKTPEVSVSLFLFYARRWRKTDLMFG